MALLRVIAVAGLLLLGLIGVAGTVGVEGLLGCLFLLAVVYIPAWYFARRSHRRRM